MKSDLKSSIKPRLRIRTRMAISYVLVTLVIVLLLEGFLISVAYYGFTRSSFLGYITLTASDHAAQVYALKAALLADDGALDPNSTFKPGQAASLVPQEEDHPRLSFIDQEVPYIESAPSTPNQPVVALLVDTAGQVIASSFPDQYPVASAVDREVPEDILSEASALIQKALQGESDGLLQDTPQGRVALIARTVWSRNRQPLGAVYIQAPAGDLPDPNIIPQITAILIPSALVWLCLMLPIGLIFGGITTRGMIKRIEGLAKATGKFSNGDFSVRVPVKKPDEIGYLEQRFNGMAEQLVESIAQRQALAEESARHEERALIEQEMSSAQYVQQSLLPDEVPAIPGWQIEPFYCPARQVGGDLYDFLSLPNGNIGIVIGDVSGKGMPAALMMATTCTMVRAAARGDFSPGELLAVVNDLLEQNTTPGMFVTCFYAILEPASGLLRFANAGHNLPYLSRDGQIIELRATGMPLGMMPEQEYPEQEIILKKGDSILFYTDGLVEAHDAHMDMFGSARLQGMLKDHSGAEHLLEILRSQLDEFTGSAWEQEDDITLVRVMKIA